MFFVVFFLNTTENVEDFNILELLQEDPDMLRLLESVNGPEAVNFLPQISVNSASRVLENVEFSQPMNTDAATSAFITLPESASFKNLCELLSMNTNENNEELKALPPSPPLSPPAQQQQTPTRTSLRLIKKKRSSDSVSIDQVKANAKKTAYSLKRKALKRGSFEDDDEVEKTQAHMLTHNPNSASPSSNENSLDLSHEDDYIYDYDQNEEDYDENLLNNGVDEAGYASTNVYRSGAAARRLRADSHADSMSLSSSSLMGGSGDPVKKESNKEAATRYRLKKLSEKDRMFETRVKLEKDNDHVKKRIELVQTEINYLKNLLVQMLLTKGALNSSNFSMA